MSKKYNCITNINIKKEEKMKKVLVQVLFATLAFLLCFGTNGFAEEGVTDTEIHICQWGPQT